MSCPMPYPCVCVCVSPNNCGGALDLDGDKSDKDSGSGNKQEHVNVISNRVPSVEHIFTNVKDVDTISKTIDHSFLFSNTDQNLLFSLKLWKPAINMLVTVMSMCVSTVKMNVKLILVLHIGCMHCACERSITRSLVGSN